MKSARAIATGDKIAVTHLIASDWVQKWGNTLIEEIE
jgi:hypothetical protein